VKNVQVIDGADNCVYDVYAIDDEGFRCLFPDGQDVAFIDEVLARGDADRLDAVFARLWERRVPKPEVNGLHGLLFYEMEHKKPYYPDRTDAGAINPNGSRLR
jgi:hypothetical protein